MNTRSSLAPSQHQGLQAFSNFSSTAASCVAVHSGRAASVKLWLWRAAMLLLPVNMILSEIKTCYDML